VWVGRPAARGRVLVAESSVATAAAASPAQPSQTRSIRLFRAFGRLEVYVLGRHTRWRDRAEEMSLPRPSAS
jgi:hypothetical protein